MDTRLQLCTLALALLPGCATLEQRAQTAAVADGATTLAAIAAGAAEANPLGLPVLLLKLPALAYINSLPDDERAAAHAIAGPLWSGAAANNLCALAVILTGGAATLPCLAVGFGYGLYAWNSTQAERDFYSACGEYRRYTGESFRCVYRLSAGL